MNKSNTILQITSEVLDRYRNSISRKAFIRAMECVIELVLGPGEHIPQAACPGLQLIRSPEMDSECLAQLLSGSCPPFQQAKADPQWEDDDTVTFYIPCWFNVDLFFSGLHVVTDENDDYINLYCAYNTKTHGVRLFFTYANNSGAEEGEQDFEVEVAMDPATAALLQDKVSAWLKPEQR